MSLLKLDSLDWDDGVVDDDKINEKVRALHDGVPATGSTRSSPSATANIEKVKLGEDLPRGVVKLAKVYVATKRKLSVGDKVAGRHGNKGVVAKIMAEEDMPYLPDGTPVDIVLNPLGVPSRMNLGQILETHLGLGGARARVPRRDAGLQRRDRRGHQGASSRRPVCRCPGKTVLYDGRTGEPFEHEVTVGYIYTMKLLHLVDDKIHARSIGPYSLVTQQPLGGKAQFGGQRFGEMEVWALEAYGASHTLQELLTVKSDDVVGTIEDVRGDREGAGSAEAGHACFVRRSDPGASEPRSGRHSGEGVGPGEEGVPCISASLTRHKEPHDFKAIQIRLASPEAIRSWSHGEVTLPETINYRSFKPEKGGLFCERIFGPVKDWECNCGKYRRIRYRGMICENCGVEVTQSKVRRERLGHIELSVPVAHVWFFRGNPNIIGRLLDMKRRDLERVLYYESYIVLDPGTTDLKVGELLSGERMAEYAMNYPDPGSAPRWARAPIAELLEAVDIEDELQGAASAGARHRGDEAGARRRRSSGSRCSTPSAARATSPRGRSWTSSRCCRPTSGRWCRSRADGSRRRT